MNKINHNKINYNKNIANYINRPNLLPYYNKVIKCIGIYTTDTIVCTGKRAACIEHVMHKDTKELLCDHLWIHINKNMYGQLKFIGKNTPIVITGKVIEYKKNHYTIYPHHINYIHKSKHHIIQDQIIDQITTQSNNQTK